MLQFKESEIHQTNPWGQKKIWTMQELLENPDALYGEPLAERMAALQQAAAWASEPPTELSAKAQLHQNFWQNFQPRNISERTYIFKTSSAETNPWELTINELGLFFKEPPGDENAYWMGNEGQLFSDFWFYGPAGPMPDLLLREKVVSVLKNAFADPDCPAAKAHFELFEYPKKPVEGLTWREGDHVRTDVVSVRSIGIETYYWTFRDPPCRPAFLSFERFLNLPPENLKWVSSEIRAAIEKHLGKKSKSSPPEISSPEPAPPSPGEKMDKAEVLLKEDPNSGEGAETLISLLEYEAQTDYWRNYVFGRFNKLRDNRHVQNFLIECLRGDNEIWFKKSVDVLSAWGFFYGDNLLADRQLLLSLNWGDACADDPDFRASFEKTTKIVLKK